MKKAGKKNKTNKNALKNTTMKEKFSVQAIEAMMKLILILYYFLYF